MITLMDGAPVTDLPPRLVLYDGVCGICNKSVQWLLRHDRDGLLRYAALQGETAERVRARHPEVPATIDTVVFVEEGRVHLRTRAFAHIGKHLGWPWRAISWMRFVPAFLADLGYNFIAAIRYRVWGKYDSCPIPKPEHRARFLP
jgi:predicted DCC family thiol-disulfide oxidoreductase YuxK